MISTGKKLEFIFPRGIVMIPNEKKVRVHFSRENSDDSRKTT